VKCSSQFEVVTFKHAQSIIGFRFRFSGDEDDEAEKDESEFWDLHFCGTETFFGSINTED
jgi:hypothetical protein